MPPAALDIQTPEAAPPRRRRVLRRIRSAVLKFDPLYRLALKLRYRTNFRALSKSPEPANLPNGVLQSHAEWHNASRSGKQLHLPLHRSSEKNWDHLAAVHAIVATTAKSARVLDAGAEIYSNVLPALFAYGYRNLYGINLSFAHPARRGPIRYQQGDITQTEFSDGFFDAVTCMSVIEHGVPIEPYFREMFRVLKPGGILITSTDYYPTPIETAGKSAHGSPIKIFSKADIESILKTAYDCGFQPTGPIDMECSTRPVRWEQQDLDFTFIIFTLQRP